MPVTVADLLARLRLDTAEFQKGLTKAETGLQQTSRKLGDLGRTLTTSLSLPLAGIATAIGLAGHTFDEAIDKIRAGTGATGPMLRRLGDDFREVFRDVPQTAGQVSRVITELNTRLGLSGEPLQRLSRQLLDLSRLTETDVSETVRRSVQLFQAWRVSTEDQGRTLDFLFRATQQTGIGMGQLLDQLVDMGPVLRTLGFSVTQAAALFGQFEQSGIQGGAAMFALRSAIDKISEPGSGFPDLATGLKSFIDQIKQAPSESLAAAKSIEFFGTRGIALGEAIRSGRFEFDQLYRALRDGTDTITKAEQDTRSFGEQWAILRNRVADALAPIGAQMLQTFEQTVFPLFVRGLSHLRAFGDAFAGLPSSIQLTIFGFGALAVAAGPLLIALAQIPKLAAAAAAGLVVLTAHPVVAAIVALGAALAVVIPYLFKVDPAAAAAGRSLLSIYEIGKLLGPKTEDVAEALRALKDAAKATEPPIKTLGKTVSLIEQNWHHHAAAIAENAILVEEIARHTKETEARLKAEDFTLQRLIDSLDETAGALRDTEIEQQDQARAAKITVDRIREEEIAFANVIDELHGFKPVAATVVVAQQTLVGSFVEGFKSIANSTRTVFDDMRTFGQATAQAIQAGFSDLFFNVFTGKITSAMELWQNFMNSMLRAVSDFLASVAIRQFLDFGFSLFGLGSGGSGGRGGVGVGGGGGGGGGGAGGAGGAAAGLAQQTVGTIAGQALAKKLGIPSTTDLAQSGFSALANLLGFGPDLSAAEAAAGIMGPGAGAGVNATEALLAQQFAAEAGAGLTGPVVAGESAELVGAGVGVEAADLFASGAGAGAGATAGLTAAESGTFIAGTTAAGAGEFAGAGAGGAAGGLGAAAGASLIFTPLAMALQHLVSGLITHFGGGRSESMEPPSVQTRWKQEAEESRASFLGGIAQATSLNDIAGIFNAVAGRSYTGGDFLDPAVIGRELQGNLFDTSAGGSLASLNQSMLYRALIQSTSPQMGMIYDPLFHADIRRNAFPTSRIFAEGAGQGIMDLLSSILGVTVAGPGGTPMEQERAAQALLLAPGLQHGGSFIVGGSGGPDSQVVSFRASPGEEVDVRPPDHGDMRGGGTLIVKVMLDGREIGEAVIRDLDRRVRAGERPIRGDAIYALSRS